MPRQKIFKKLTPEEMVKLPVEELSLCLLHMQIIVSDDIESFSRQKNMTEDEMFALILKIKNDTDTVLTYDSLKAITSMEAQNQWPNFYYKKIRFNTSVNLNNVDKEVMLRELQRANHNKESLIQRLGVSEAQILKYCQSLKHEVHSQVQQNDRLFLDKKCPPNIKHSLSYITNPVDVPSDVSPPTESALKKARL